MIKAQMDVKQLIGLVDNGGKIITGVDIYNQGGMLLIEKDAMITRVETLQRLLRNSVTRIPISVNEAGGLWDKEGNPLALDSEDPHEMPHLNQEKIPKSEMAHRLKEIQQLKQKAWMQYEKAQKVIQTVFSEIRTQDGEFNLAPVEALVMNLIQFLSKNRSGFMYLTREILSYEAYIYNHAINVCALGYGVLDRFNTHFGAMLNSFFNDTVPQGINGPFNPQQKYRLPYYYSEELKDITLGLLLHDVGKALYPDHILNKQGRLNQREYEYIKTHSFEKGLAILEKNNIKSSFIRNIVAYHHAALYAGEQECYPLHRSYHDLPPYVKICKLVDIYDAMTSKRAYREAFNPIGVVTDIFRSYAQKDHFLQFILHAYVKTIGIYPPGSILHLTDGRIAYVIESHGPLVIPFTDTTGKPIDQMPEPLQLESISPQEIAVDTQKALVSPLEIYHQLPQYLK